MKWLAFQPNNFSSKASPARRRQEQHEPLFSFFSGVPLKNSLSSPTLLSPMHGENLDIKFCVCAYICVMR